MQWENKGFNIHGAQSKIYRRYCAICRRYDQMGDHGEERSVGGPQQRWYDKRKKLAGLNWYGIAQNRSQLSNLKEGKKRQKFKIIS